MLNNHALVGTNRQPSVNQPKPIYALRARLWKAEHVMAQHILLTPALLEQIVADVRAGAYAKVAATRAGINPYTFRLWYVRGQQLTQQRAGEVFLNVVGEPPDLYEEFYLRVSAAQAEAEADAAKRVFTANPQFWLTHSYTRDDWRPAHPAADGFTAADDFRVAEEAAALGEASANYRQDTEHASAKVDKLTILNPGEYGGR
jgi:hypothetical protein